MNDQVRAAVEQWLARAQSDWQTVTILAASAASPREAICFHCQQYVEKLLKAALTLQGIEAPRTHDLRRLVQLAASHLPELSSLAEAADSVTQYAVAMRYPDEWRLLEADEVYEAMDLARQFAAILLPRLE